MNFCTHAIEDLKRFAGVWCSSGIEGRADAVGVANMALWLGSSTKFLLPQDGDVGVKVTTLAAMKYVRCPYPVTAFEFSMNTRTELDPDGRYAALGAPVESSIKRIAIVMELSTFLNAFPEAVRGMMTKVTSQEERDKNNSLVVMTVSHMEAFGKWMPSPIAVMISRDTGIVEEYTGDGIEYRGTAIPLMPGLLSELCKSNGMTLAQLITTQMMDVSYEIGVAFSALACLNARNVKAIDIEAPSQLNKKRLKNGKAPFFEYKVLDIFLGDKVRQAQSGAGKRVRSALEHWMKSGTKLHAVRGHFKVRKTGIFWWSNFYRGNSGKGEVTKDYNMKTA